MTEQGAGHASSGFDHRPRRVRAVQDPLNLHLFHPLAWRLARLLANTGITPNMVSVAGGGLVVLAAALYVEAIAGGWGVAGAVLGFALHLGWHVVDGADGDLARMTGRSGPRGEIVDGLCDYLSHIVLYVALGAVLATQIGAGGWLVMVVAGLSRVVQANHYEVMRRQYLAWLHDTAWLGGDTRDVQAAGRLAGVFAGAYVALAGLLAPHVRAIDRALQAAQDDAPARARLTQAIRDHSRAMLRDSAPLGANWRTIALGGSMLAGTPLYFFLFEAVLLNLVLLRSLHNAVSARRAILAAAQRPAASAVR